MTKKQKIFGFLVVLPLICAYFYNRMFKYAGNWLEDYQNHFKFGFLLLAIFASLWLVVISKKEKKQLWLIGSVALFLVLTYIFYMGLNIVSITF